jgi:L-lactate dehydrogenase complex protein LldG
VASSPLRWRTAQKLAALGAKILSIFTANPKRWLRLPAFTGWGYAKAFPAPAMRTFLQQYNGKTVRHAGNSNTPLAEPLSSTYQPPNHPLPEVDRVKQFSAEVSALGGEVRLTSSRALPAAIASFLQQEHVNQLLSWEPSHLPKGLIEELTEQGIKIGYELDPTAQAGLTGAVAAAADTGTLLIPGGQGRPLSASLLPPIHIAILDHSALLPDLSEVFAIHGKLLRQTASAAALVSGPSRTADIEMTLTLGVHGPKRLIVFLNLE